MPFYLDYYDVSMVTAEDIGRLHLEDLKPEINFGCRILTYWFDKKQGTAFCLIEAPDEIAVKKMHDKMHTLPSARILEIDPIAINTFLTQIENPVTLSSEMRIDPAIPEPSNRALMIICWEDFIFLKLRIGEKKALSALRSFEITVRKLSEEYSGIEKRNLPDCTVYSFNTVIQALKCLAIIRQELNIINQEISGDLRFRFGICPEYPANKNPWSFVMVLQLANRLCRASSGDIAIGSSETRNQIKGHIHSETGFDKIVFLNQEKENFLINLVDTLESCWDQVDLNVIDFARKLGLSKSGLYRMIIKTCKCSPKTFIKEYRLRKAVEAIEKQEGNISEIAYRCGFNGPSYFSKCFLERFGMLPSSFAIAAV